MNLREEIVHALQPHVYLSPVALISSKEKVHATKRQCLKVKRKKNNKSASFTEEERQYMPLEDNCDVENTTKEHDCKPIKKKSFFFLVHIYIKKARNLAINFARSL